MSTASLTITQIQKHVWAQLWSGNIRFDHPNYSNRLIGEAWIAGASQEQLGELIATNCEKLDVLSLSNKLVRNAGRGKSRWNRLLKGLDEAAWNFIVSSGGLIWLYAPTEYSPVGLRSNLQLTATLVNLIARGAIMLLGEPNVDNVHQGALYALSEETKYRDHAATWVQNAGLTEELKLEKLMEALPIIEVMDRAFEEREAARNEAPC